MKISRALNLVIPLETEKGRIYVHHTPISVDVYETFYRVIGLAAMELFKDSPAAYGNPRAAYLLLKEMATAGMNEERAIESWSRIQHGLLNEIVRLTNVAYADEKGWQQIPLQNAISRNILDEEDKREIEGRIVFFTLLEYGGRKEEMRPIMQRAAHAFGLELISSSFTDYLNSLKTSTEKEITSPNAMPMPVPSQNPLSIPH